MISPPLGLHHTWLHGIGQIIEYGSDRYFVKINAVVQGKEVEKTITVDGS